MALRFGTAAITDLRLGSAAVDKLMMGDVQVWPVAVEPPPGGELWTPADLPGLYSWHEAWDASTLVLNGNAVMQWSDKSNNGRHYVSADGADQPTYDATAKRIVASVAQSNVRLNRINDMPQQPIELVIGSVIQRDVSYMSGAGVFCLTNKGIGESGSYGVPGFHTTFSGAMNFFDGSTMQYISGEPSLGNEEGFFVNHFAPDGSTLRTMGEAAVASETAPFQVLQDASTQPQTLFYWWPRDHQFRGTLAVIVEVYGSITADDALRLEGYMAHGASRADLLPTDHPYKSTPPTKPTP